MNVTSSKIYKNVLTIISPAIDMIELISARGNTSLESAVTLTKTLRWEIQSLGQRLAMAANTEEQIQRRGTKPQDKARHTSELRNVVQAIRKLLNRIEDAVPLINLAITASGASLSSSLPSTVSPSRLLQASTFLTAGDSQYGSSNSLAIQIGPIFTLSMYMLFQGHLRPQNEDDVRESTWKEVMHKADVRLMRVPINALYDLPGTCRDCCVNGVNVLESSSGSHNTGDDSAYSPTKATSVVRADEYAYQLVIVEDLEDDRVHTFEANEQQPEPYGDIPLAGIREAVPIHELSKIFYADTGKILNIGSEGEANSPVLLLKRDTNAIPPRRMMDRHGDSDGRNLDDDTPNGSVRQLIESPERRRRSLSHSSANSEQQGIHAANPWRLPQDLDPEWIAFEVYTEAEDSDTEAEEETDSPQASRSSFSTFEDPSMTCALSGLKLGGAHPLSQSRQTFTAHKQQHLQPTLPPIRTSLSLLEMLLRLLSLQQFQQTPHLSIPDELLNFFLSESASTGAASNDVQERKRLREEARRHVGFDPYNESPVKRRGEEYQYRGGDGSQHWDDEGRNYSENGYSSPLTYEDEGYGTKDWQDGRQSSTSREATPQAPQTPLRLKNRSRSRTPHSSSPVSGCRPPPVARWNNALKTHVAGVRPGGSPLARPTTGMTDEGLDSSPASDSLEQTKR
ncbi:MAG: hypothetical protein Q9164_001113 [Protoblastenia rupestris]